MEILDDLLGCVMTLIHRAVPAQSWVVDSHNRLARWISSGDPFRE